MEPRQFQARLLILRSALLLAFLTLVVRLWYLQISQWSKHRVFAEQNRTAITWIPAPRGTICDRHGEPLADNHVVYQIHVIPSELPRARSEFNAALVPIARVLNVSTVEVEKAVREARRVGGPETVLPSLGESIDRIQAIRLEERRREMPGFRIVEAQRRHYPFGSLAAHAIGYARAITPEQLHQVENLEYEDPPGGPESRLSALIGKQKVYGIDSIFGQAGVESLCELVNINGRVVPALQGRRGANESERDVSNEPRLVRHIPPIPGATVYLTLDRRIQQITEKALAHPFPTNPAREAEGGAAVLVDVQTGEIIAMASYPTFDLDKYTVGDRAELARIAADGRSPHWNRAIAGLYPPASTFKIISSCAILETTQPRTTLNTTYTCTGRERLGRHEWKRCWDERGHGPVDFISGIAMSCDVYFWDAVKYAGLTPEAIARYAREFGLGELPGTGLPSEKEGLVPTPAWKREQDRGRWYLGDTANLVIGQGDLKVTPLQMALATAAIANRGFLPRPHIVRKIVWPAEAGVGTAQWPKQSPRRIAVKRETLEAVRRGMRAAVTHPRGTARGPMADLPVTVAAKTGSAEVRLDRPTHSWFVWFAPYERPRYACAVIVEYGGYGSEVAGYVARAILLAAFGQQNA